ncbi:MAG: hypothetical protein A2078_15440 [Nitrospirae bacterium GWC2_57_9]|nr:MAG: hypothetical protein A2078_15440 [Nitrospirae bacterium GWC2_57_9]
MRKTALFACLLLCSAACTSVPFRQAELVPLSEDPARVVERFRAATPESFHLLSSVVFEYNWQAFSGLSSIEIDRADAGFKVAGMTAMGVKLFELSGDREGITTRYSVAALSKYGDLAAAVGNDIRRIYFDLVPGPQATIWRRKKKLVFRQPSGTGFLEYVFAGAAGDLIEKNYYEDSGIVWRAAYYEYADQRGKRFPQGIVFIHYDYGYRLTVRHKEFRFENN